MNCPSPSCFCSWPPVRRIPSTGDAYSMEEIAPGVYRYVYLPPASEPMTPIPTTGPRAGSACKPEER